MKKIIGKLILKLLGWKVILDGNANNLNRCILVVAPHTHNLEYLLGNLTYWSLGKSLKIIIKDAHTKAWYGGIVKGLGGIGIDRSQKNDLVNFVANLFEKEDFSLVITPEGTRSYVQKWRKGFYHMALKARVPIVLATGDFKRKISYIGKKISVEELETKSYEDILKTISDYYIEKDIHPKVPENWNPNIQ
ncbi:1-acyl-sn-glycerol-3-phosphate acyltransferase [Riemerella columbipharyngis]|uniref:Acyltransferase n=1 Tax=Riemerella columbipharyngis TaxID=1071918 RepID=A0A1G6YCZ6_9FLAO|nr:1-acyl-sn-glycerol-3-phosphate acyltransferase [Riemerella columbipharyngis]SDD87466.1 Acyltransferase [Riemerella columbipharyngis]